jgi:hypothetical protein
MSKSPTCDVPAIFVNPTRTSVFFMKHLKFTKPLKTVVLLMGEHNLSVFENNYGPQTYA